MLIVETRPIFSVIATEHSFVFGVIRYEKRSFVRMLVNKISGHILPTELTTLIEDQLFEHYWAPVAKSWERTNGLWAERFPGLFWENYMTEDALRAWCKLAESLNLTLAAREGPYPKYLPWGSVIANDNGPYVVHLARAGRYSHGGVGLRQSWSRSSSSSSSSSSNNNNNNNNSSPNNAAASSLPSPPDAAASYEKESLRVDRLRSGICSTSVDGGGGRGTACAKFVASTGRAPMGISDRVDRFMEVDGLEEEMAAWDRDAVAKCAAILGLEMVGNGGGDGDGMRPRLRLVQSFAADRTSLGSEGPLLSV